MYLAKLRAIEQTCDSLSDNPKKAVQEVRYILYTNPEQLEERMGSLTVDAESTSRFEGGAPPEVMQAVITELMAIDEEETDEPVARGHVAAGPPGSEAAVRPAPTTSVSERARVARGQPEAGGLRVNGWPVPLTQHCIGGANIQCAMQ